ncbi:nuclear transport factor 2 family protein [Montanilutibacter psychrotolerans]|uniref:Nuclear transport factor 2 family protein n=1 Tax=Montanilutibacter psychrotolerans TaxID=1327343 RepID=A0A3M8SYB8_9GAMM|nr:nuclear transport factor 2 family protein [Lysobacter psychrotolerans]RNF86239.1 nuclear transport factor 2 family protein [Lysobacter psychrotolerans]
MKMAILLSTIFATAPAFAQSAELEAAKVPLQNYIRAQETGNADYVREAFTADARITGNMAGRTISWSLEQYADRFTGEPAADESQRKRHIEILELTGDAGVGKVTLDYPAVRFVDYMSLVKVDGVWKIVGKSFHALAKPKP